jgi:hypothetical protein
MGKRFTVSVRYSGFDEEKNEHLVKLTGRDPSEQNYEPNEGRCTIVWEYQNRLSAHRMRKKLQKYLETTKTWEDGFWLSKVTDAGY